MLNQGVKMKAMTRQQLADCAGVTTKTLKNWCEPYKKELEILGMKPNQILPPSVVEWLADHYSINIE